MASNPAVPPVDLDAAAWSRLAGIAVVVLAFGWLPGQTSAGALRHWMTVGALPLLVALRHPALPRAVWPWLALVVLTGVGATWAPHAGSVLTVALTQFGWLAALVLGTHCDSRRLAPWVSAAGAVGALGLWSFGNPDYAAAFVVGTVPWTLAAAAWGHRRAHAVSLGAQLIALVALESLGAWVALGMAAAGVGVVWGGRWRKAALALVLVGVGATTTTLVQEHIAGRLYLAKISIKIAQLEPVSGVGPGAFHGAFLEGQAGAAAGDLWTNATHAHNEAVHVATEQGLPGVLLLLLPIGLAIGRPGSGSAPARRPGPAWAATLAYATLGLVTMPLYMPGTAWLAALSLGVALGRGTRSWIPPRGLAVALALPALALASATLLSDRLLRRASERGDAALAEVAARLSLEPARALRVASQAHLNADRETALEQALAAQYLDPSVEGWMLIGRTQMAQGRYPPAAHAFEEAVRLCPRLFSGWYNLSRAHEDGGNRGAAVRAAQRARSLLPDDPRLVHLPR